MTKLSTGPAREIGAYGGACAIALGSDLAVLATLVERAGWHYIPAAILGFCVGTLVAYLLCIRYVFRVRRMTSAPAELTLFWVIGVFGLGLNTALLGLLVEAFHVHYFAAKLCAAIVSFVVNYALRKSVLFSAVPAADSKVMETIK